MSINQTNSTASNPGRWWPQFSYSRNWWGGYTTYVTWYWVQW